MRTAIALVRPGGYFVFGQDLADPDAFGKYEWFDEGHPIRPTASDLESHLAEVTTVFSRTVPPRDPRLQTGVLVYAGRCA